MADLDPSAHNALTVDVRRDDGTVVIRLCGDLDLAGFDEARAAIDAALGSQPRRVILDTTALDYMDSSGIVLLVQVARAAQQVQVRNPRPIVRRLIELTGLSGMLQITDDDNA